MVCHLETMQFRAMHVMLVCIMAKHTYASRACFVNLYTLTG